MTSIWPNRHGWNVNCAMLEPKTERDIVDLFVAQKPTTGLFMHGAGTALQVHQALHGQIEAVVRSDGEDGTLWKRTSAAEYARTLDRRNQKSGTNAIRWYVLNEPKLDRREDLHLLLKWLCDFMDESVKLGVKSAIGNFATGHIIEINEVDAGWWDTFLEKASKYGRLPGKPVIIGFDDYCWGVIPVAGSGQAHGIRGKDYWHWNMLKPELVQPDRWPDQFDMTERNWRSNYNFMRWMWLVKRAFDKGYSFKATEWGEEFDVPFWIYSGEGYLDRIMDWETELKKDQPYEGRTMNLIPRLDNYAWDHGLLPRGQKIHGPLDQRALYPWWFPQWTPEDTYVELLCWTNSVMPRYWIGGDQFTLANDHELAEEGISWQANHFNFFDWPDVMARITERNSDIRASYKGYASKTQEEPPTPPVVVQPPDDPPVSPEPPENDDDTIVFPLSWEEYAELARIYRESAASKRSLAKSYTDDAISNEALAKFYEDVSDKLKEKQV